MILVDTSAWVEYDRHSESRTDQRLSELIAAGGVEINVTEPVLMEVLAGASDEQRAGDLRRLLTSFTWTPADASTDFEAAARVYRVCRAAGITPRGLIDCMVVAIAQRTDCALLAADKDFERIAQVVPFRVDRPR